MLSKLKKNRGKVILKFLLIFSVLFIISKIAPLHPLKVLTAALVWNTLNLLGIHAELVGNHIIYDNTEFIIVTECTGIESILILISILLADDLLKKKKEILIIGVPILYIWNIIRVTISIIIGIEFTHFVLWMVSVLIILGLVGFGYAHSPAQDRKKDTGNRKRNEHRIRKGKSRKRTTR